MIADIFQFNSQALGVHPRVALGLTGNEVEFLCKAVEEELQEFVEASGRSHPKTSDTLSPEDAMVHQVDALIDLAYFAIGGLARAGLTASQAQACFDAIHRANMRKKLGTTHRGDLGVADATKPSGWVSPEPIIKEVLFGAKPQGQTP